MPFNKKLQVHFKTKNLLKCLKLFYYELCLPHVFQTLR